jgi:N-methylhydantoinase A
MMRCGVDTGGTFTDLIALDAATGHLVVAKWPSSPANPVRSITGVFQESGLQQRGISSLVLGTTISLNALLQRRGATVFFVTTRGFEDVPFIQRMNRRHHYSFEWMKPKPLVERRNCLGVDERIDSKGKVLTPLTDEAMEDVAASLAEGLSRSNGGEHSIAICLLFSYLNGEHELRLKQYLESRFPGVPLSASHEIAPIWREYERGVTVVADAFVKPMLRQYVASVRESLQYLGLDCPWSILKSNAGHATAASAENQPVNVLLSGLSGGMVGGKYFGDLAGEPNVVTLDMGGTSCDVGVVRDGKLAYVTNYEVEWGMPISAPFVDLTTIGAGGGSIAWIDKGGFLRVGPQSAGAEPGPVCYDQGGTEVTVTDANLIMGRLNASYFLGGKMALNAEKARNAMMGFGERLGLGPAEAAQAVLDVANENMANAIRLVSIERGLDVRRFALVAFGGAGPLHACGIAGKVGIERIVIPLHPGLCSAFGALIADFQVDKVQSQNQRSTAANAAVLNAQFQALVDGALRELRGEGFDGEPEVRRTISMRYSGQNYEHEMPVQDTALTEETLGKLFEQFHRLHEQFYGYSISGEVIEIIRLSATVIGQTPKPCLQPVAAVGSPQALGRRQVYFQETGFISCPIFRRNDLPADTKLSGPAIVEEVDSTLVLHPGQSLTVDATGIIRIRL